MNRFPNLYRFEVLQRVLRLFKRVQWQRRGVLRLVHLVVERGIFFLQVARIGKNDSAQIDRRRTGVNGTAKALFYQARNPAAMVQVSVSEDDCINFLRGNWSIPPVALPPFLWSLKQASVD